MNWVVVLELLGAAQGLFLAVLLASRDRNWLPNRILAFVMVSFAFELLSAVYHDLGLEAAYPHLIGLTFSLPFVYTPAMYLYAATLTRGVQHIEKRHVYHLIPFLLAVAFTLPFYLQSGPDKVLAVMQPEGSSWSGVLTVINYFKFPYSLAYLVAILAILRRHRTRVRDEYSYLDKINLGWLRSLMIGGLFVWTVSLVFFVMGMTGLLTAESADPITGVDDYVMLAITVYVYAIGFLGLRQPEIFAQPVPAVPATPTLPAVPDTSAQTGSAELQRYSKSGLSASDAGDMKEDLLELMDGKRPYTNPDLTLLDLARLLDTSNHNVSQTLNAELGENFYDFINRYRVTEIKARLEDDSNSHLTILSIGLDAGFNSKSSFNSVFKKKVGMTPSQYRASLKSAIGDR